jgi:diguanylate cyclase (GGDEF)-like protein
MRPHLREEDLVAYFGDATFAFLLPDMSGESAKAVMEQLQMRLAWTPFELEQSGVKINLNCAAGVVAFDHDAMERDELMLKANQALQRAGANGHGQVYLATDEPNNPPERPANEREQTEHRKITD